jgi:Tfp pilus assembly protein PilP
MWRAAISLLMLMATVASPAAQKPASPGQAPQAASAARGAPPAQPSQPAPPASASAGQARGRGTAPAAAQTAGRGTPPAQSAQTPAQAKTDQLLEPPGFTYTPEGRRDPFVSLVRRGSDVRGSAQAKRPAGLAGLSVAEVTLRGTVRSREGFVAILQGADQRAYIVRPGDKLFDGTIRAVSQNDVVILQQVNDPLSLENQREVRKVLRQPEAN